MLSSKYLVYSSIDLDLQASQQPKCPGKSKQNDSESSLDFQMTIEFGSAHSSLQHRQGFESVKNASIYIKHHNINQYLNFHDDPICYECVFDSWDHLKLKALDVEARCSPHRGFRIACCPSRGVLAPLRIAKTSDFGILKSPYRKLISSVVS